VTPRSLSSLLGVIEQSPTLIEGIGLAGEKREKCNCNAYHEDSVAGVILAVLTILVMLQSALSGGSE